MLFLRSRFVSFVFAFLLFAPAVVASGNYTPFRADMRAGDAYTIDAHRLHPTQFSLGFREVDAKSGQMNRMPREKLIAYLKRKDVPVVIGPGGVPYLTDGHHTIRALLNSRVEDKTVYGHVIANWANLDTVAFWAQMRAHHYTYLKDAAGRGPLDPSHLPATLLTMQSDPYRSLAWALMHRGGFQELSGDKCYFQEFFWGDFFRGKVTWNDRSDADFERAVAQALTIAHSPAAAALPGYLPPKEASSPAMANAAR